MTNPTKDARQLARVHTQAAVNVLAGFLTQKKGVPHAIRVKCAEILLDRGHGKAPQSVEHTGGLEIAHDRREVAKRIVNILTEQVNIGPGAADDIRVLVQDKDEQ